jgi:purine-binding chemotaxis protein CheW
MENIQKQLAQVMSVEQNSEENEKKIATVDFKMVTFSLSGKDYAIDIMSVKEIAKAGRFTYVPNTAPFVLGVYNLRGEIIPIIDLRLFFNIEVEERSDNQIENMIIVSVDDNVFGIVVDGIDKVVGIQKSTIQPPHPLFGDINIKYIYGVVESENRLYVLLDIARIFSNKPKSEKESVDSAPKLTVSKLPQTTSEVQAPQVIKRQEIPTVREPVQSQEQVVQDESEVPTVSSIIGQDLQQDNPLDFSQERQDFSLEQNSQASLVDFDFIVDELKSLKKFYVTDINSSWVKSRFVAWQDEKGVENSQLNSEQSADEFLKGFYSENTGEFWSEEYANRICACLPENTAKQIVVWNPGCGKGYEAYSLACVLKKRYPDSRIRIYSQDIDLLNVSNASLLTVSSEYATSWLEPFLTQNVSGSYVFIPEIKDMIMFEYHDCTNTNSLPNADLILCRDLLSFLPADVQNNVLLDFEDRLKGNGIMILGENESLAGKMQWSENLIENISIYTK